MGPSDKMLKLSNSSGKVLNTSLQDTEQDKDET